MRQSSFHDASSDALSEAFHRVFLIVDDQIAYQFVNLEKYNIAVTNNQN